MDCIKWGGCLKRVTICMLVLALILGSGFTNSTTYAGNAMGNQGVGFSDIEGHWAKEQVLDWSENGLVSGYDDGTFKPERGVSRAEFITFVNRAYGLIAKDRVDFVDVLPRDWFADEVAKAVTAGYISGYEDGTMRPAAGISRLEAAVILEKLLRLSSLEDERWVTGFNDSEAIAVWGREYVNSVIGEGYFSGYPDGTFKPDRVITRAETITLLSKALGTLYNAPGTYGPEVSSETITGNVTVNVSDVTLQNLVIEGDLFLTAGIGDGGFEADGVVVKGRTIISGGGERGVVFNNTSLEEVTVYEVDGKVRVAAKGSTNIGSIVLETGAHLQEKDLTGGGFSNVQVMMQKPGESIELEGDFDRVNIETAVNVSVAGDTRIGELKVSKDAEGTNINTNQDTMIETLTLDGATDVTGQGTIKTAYANTRGYSFEKDPGELIVDGEKVEEENETSGGGGGGGGGGGSGPPPTPITYTLTLKVEPAGGGTVQGAGRYQQGKRVVVTASVNPGFKFVNWTRGGTEVSTSASYQYTMPGSNTTLTANFEPVTTVDSAPISELCRTGVSVNYYNEPCFGVRQLVEGVYNVELDMNKVKETFGEIEGYELALIIEDKTVKGEGGAGEVNSFIVKEGYAVLPAVQRGIQDEDIQIDPETLAKGTVILVGKEGV
ncbi:MAG: S-layer homology domain-containing protein [Clostridia bacterium]